LNARMTAKASDLRPGLALADSRVETEANSYLRGRLLLFYRVIIGGAAAMYVLSHLARVATGEWSPAHFVVPSAVVHLSSCVLGGGVLLALRRPALRSRSLTTIDAFGVALCAGTILAIYGLLYSRGPHQMPGILAVFLIARAVVVPSSARCTLLFSLPAAFALLAIQLANGVTYEMGGAPAPHGAFVEVIIWSQATVLFGIVVAAVASHANFSLRTQLHEARQLGQYRLESKIGQGGMGEVYRATHAMLRRPTAVKLLKPDLTGEQSILRFQREVRQTSRLTSPHAISIFDYGHTADGLFYYAMEYLDGADLEEIVERTGPVPAGRVIHVLIQVCRALEEAHPLGLVHRDLKPGNIMVCRIGGRLDQVKVVDFGLVKDLASSDGSLTEVGAICGTPETLAPEIIEGEPPGPAADLYALGVVAHHALTAKPLFESKSTLDLIRHHADTIPRRPSEDLPVPEDLEAVVMRCLEKRPEDRFADAAALRAALEGCEAAGSWTEEDAAGFWGRFRPLRG
jgi:hypothetical protein